MLSYKGSKGFPLGKKFSYTFQSSGILKLPFDQPFMNQRMFGYGDLYLRGLENYVIDGVGGFLVRNTLRRQVVNIVAISFQSCL